MGDALHGGCGSGDGRVPSLLTASIITVRSTWRYCHKVVECSWLKCMGALGMGREVARAGRGPGAVLARRLHTHCAIHLARQWVQLGFMTGVVFG